jgi:hypothetical protein
MVELCNIITQNSFHPFTIEYLHHKALSPINVFITSSLDVCRFGNEKFFRTSQLDLYPEQKGNKIRNTAMGRSETDS